MRKISITLVALIMVLSITTVYAESDFEHIEPRFNVISAATSSIYGSEGSITSIVRVYTPTNDSIDRIYINVNVKKNTGEHVETYNRNMLKTGTLFTFEEKTHVARTGYYLFEYTIKCYKNGLVVDEMMGASEPYYHNV